ncbi:hypothetical protein Tco_0578507 [Tanacetum coccineum]
MERKECIVSLVYFVTLLGVYSTIDLVAASKVLTEKNSNEKLQSEVQFTKTEMGMNFHETFCHMRRSIQEQGDIGPVDVCAILSLPSGKGATTADPESFNALGG